MPSAADLLNLLLVIALLLAACGIWELMLWCARLLRRLGRAIDADINARFGG